MDVVILCGGKGTRLSEDTKVKPKPMVEINGIPILIHIMRIYSYFGFKRFIIALGYKGNYIKEYFYNYRITRSDLNITLDSRIPIQYFNHSNELDWNINLIDTGQDVLKSERIKKVQKYITTDNFHLTYGDGVSDIDISELVTFHKTHKSIGTVTAVHPPSRFGQLLLDGSSVQKFDEKSQMSSEYINGGFFIFNKKIFSYLNNSEMDFEFDILKKVVADNELKAFKHNGFWQCMDNVRERDYLNKLAINNNAPWIRGYSKHV